MANVPITDILMPDEEARGRMVVAGFTLAAGGGNAVVTATLDPGYPPIDQTIPCPIMAIAIIDDSAGGLLADGVEGFNIVNHMILAPDSQGEFLVTGDRTINIFQVVNDTMVGIVAYISKGSGNKV